MRRFPTPWTMEALDGGFKIVDSNGQTLAYVYGHADPGDARIAKALTLDESRRIASNIAKLPSLLLCVRSYAQASLAWLLRRAPSRNRRKRPRCGCLTLRRLDAVRTGVGLIELRDHLRGHQCGGSSPVAFCFCSPAARRNRASPTFCILPMGSLDA
jgi:hypothetical protein